MLGGSGAVLYRGGQFLPALGGGSEQRCCGGDVAGIEQRSHCVEPLLVGHVGHGGVQLREYLGEAPHIPFRVEHLNAEPV